MITWREKYDELFLGGVSIVMATVDTYVSKMM